MPQKVFIACIKKAKEMHRTNEEREILLARAELAKAYIKRKNKINQ